MSSPVLRRSLLYVPASNARALEKARTLPADGFIIDLEDAVLPDAKSAAREAAVALVRAGGFGSRQVLVRVNALDTEMGRDDIAALAEAKVDALLVPKVMGPETLRQAAALLTARGSRARLWAMMETARSILYARELAGFGKPLAGIVIGTNDLAKELRCDHPADRRPMITALQTCVLAARSFGLAVIDGVHIDLDDEIGFRDSCRQSRAMGFDGRSLIHPKQIAGANEAYGPSPDAIERAGRIVAAYRAASAAGQAVTVVDGRLVELLHVRDAERILAEAEAIAVLDADQSRDKDSAGSGQ